MKGIHSLFTNIGKRIAIAAMLFLTAGSFHLLVSAQTRSGHFAPTYTGSTQDTRRHFPPKRLPDPPVILSFTIAPLRIQAGQTATLQWSTTNTERVFIGEPDPEWRTSGELIRAARAVELSGSLVVNPSKTATYRIKVQKGGRSVYKDVTVLVMIAPTPPATCSISGQIFGRLTWNSSDDRGQPFSATLRQVYISSDGTDPRVYTRLRGRMYTFTNVPAGQTYKISPDNFRARPREITVSCQPGTSHRGLDFELTGAPPSG